MINFLTVSTCAHIIRMAKVNVGGLKEDLWSWWMTRILEGKLLIGKKVTNNPSLRYTQTAVSSFGPSRHFDCGQKPGGFTRLTPEVLNWVKTVTGIEYHAGINDPGEMKIVQHHCLH